MEIDEKRLAELKAVQLQKFSGQTKVTTERCAVGTMWGAEGIIASATL